VLRANGEFILRLTTQSLVDKWNAAPALSVRCLCAAPLCSVF
jgi:hypothetical protein